MQTYIKIGDLYARPIRKKLFLEEIYENFLEVVLIPVIVLE